MVKYNSSVLMGLEPIGRDVFHRFANHHLSAVGKSISAAAFAMLYDAYDGVTWYVHYVLSMLCTRPASGAFEVDNVRAVIREILVQHHFVFQSLLYQLTVKQKQVLVAVAAEGGGQGHDVAVLPPEAPSGRQHSAGGAQGSD